MTRFQQFDLALRERGFCYDVGEEEFYDGERLLEWEELICRPPEMTLDELASYQDDRYDKLRAVKATTKVAWKKG